MEQQDHKWVGQDRALSPVPLEDRQHWITPAVIFGGLEFTIPVLMVGAALTGSFSLKEIIIFLIFGLVIIQWIGNTLQGYMGAKTGRSSSVIARASFGALQAKIIVGFTIFIVSMGWWALQTAVAGNAISAMLGVDYKEEWLTWALITIVCGILFAVPSILGYNSMKWTDYIAVPAGIVLIIGGIYYSMKNTGFDVILSWNPTPTMTIWAALSLIIGANVGQWVIASDYTRYAKPTWKDNILIPLGIIGVGFPLFLVGAIMAVGVGDADIVNVMTGLGFPIWGFLILWFATWTSQLVNNYSMGLALANIFNVNSGKGRAMLTMFGTMIAIVIALLGILDYFMDFLYLTALLYPAIGGVMMADFFLIRKQTWEDHEGWNWVATWSLIIGVLVGYVTQYMYPFGIPAVQSLIISIVVYYVGMKIKGKVAPDQFTQVREG